MNIKSLLIVGAGFMMMSALTSCSGKEQTQQTPPVRVKTVVAATVPVTNTNTYSGTITENMGTVLSFKVPGTLKTLYVSEGTKVAKGQLIGELDAQSLKNMYDISLASLATAQDTYDRMAKLHAAGTITDMKWVEIENALSAAKSSAAIALNNLNDARLYAPFSGYISEKIADIGSTVAPAAPVVKLVKIENVKITISVGENEISKMSKGAEAMFNVPALGEHTYRCTLTDKNVTANPLSRTYEVTFICPNPEGSLLPGMICRLSLLADNTKEAITLPVSAVLLDDSNRYFVWTDNNGHAEKRYVIAKTYSGEKMIIESGLTEGDKVIVEGQQKVSSNTAITAID